MENPQMLSFREVSDIFESARARDPFLAGFTLQDFARAANEATGSSVFSAGDRGVVGRKLGFYNLAAEDFIKSTGVEEPFRKLGELIGGKTGGEAAATVPRTLAQFGTLSNPLTAPIGLADVFMQNYGETGSLPAAMIGTGTFLAAPKVGGKLADTVAQRLAKTTIPGGVARGVEKVAELGGLTGAFAGGGAVQAAELAREQDQPMLPAALESVKHMFSPEGLKSQAAIIAAFELMGLPRTLKGYKGGYKQEGFKIEPFTWKDMVVPPPGERVRSVTDYYRRVAEDQALTKAAMVGTGRDLESAIETDEAAKLTAARVEDAQTPPGTPLPPVTPPKVESKLVPPKSRSDELPSAEEIEAAFAEKGQENASEVKSPVGVSSVDAPKPATQVAEGKAGGVQEVATKGEKAGEVIAKEEPVLTLRKAALRSKWTGDVITYDRNSPEDLARVEEFKIRFPEFEQGSVSEDTKHFIGSQTYDIPLGTQFQDLKMVNMAELSKKPIEQTQGMRLLNEEQQAWVDFANERLVEKGQALRKTWGKKGATKEQEAEWKDFQQQWAEAATGKPVEGLRGEFEKWQKEKQGPTAVQEALPLEETIKELKGESIGSQRMESDTSPFAGLVRDLTPKDAPLFPTTLTGFPEPKTGRNVIIALLDAKLVPGIQAEASKFELGVTQVVSAEGDKPWKAVPTESPKKEGMVQIAFWLPDDYKGWIQKWGKKKGGDQGAKVQEQGKEEVAKTSTSPVASVAGRGIEETAPAISKEVPPKVGDKVYEGFHGGDVPIKVFDNSKIGTRTDPGFFGQGHYFVSDKDNAQRWGKVVTKANITLKNPLVVSGITEFVEKAGQRKTNSKGEYAVEMKRVTDDLKKKGYDGVVINRSDGIQQVVAFDASSVKVVSEIKPAMHTAPTVPEEKRLWARFAVEVLEPRKEMLKRQLQDLREMGGSDPEFKEELKATGDQIKLITAAQKAEGIAKGFEDDFRGWLARYAREGGKATGEVRELPKQEKKGRVWTQAELKALGERQFALGATTEEVAKMLAGFNDRPRSGKELAQEIAELTGISQVVFGKTDPHQYLLDTERYFRSFFSRTGIEGDRLEYLTNGALRLAAAFDAGLSGARIFEGKDGTMQDGYSTFWGQAFAKEGAFNDLIVLAKDIPKMGQESMDVARRLFLFAHEAAHLLDDRLSGVESELGRRLGLAKRDIRQLSPDDMAKAIKTLTYHALGQKSIAGFYSMQEMKRVGDRYRALQVENSEMMYKEFLADVTGVMALGAANPRSRGDLRDLMLFGDPATQGLMRGLYVDLSLVVNATKGFFRNLLTLNRKLDPTLSKKVELFENIQRNLRGLLKTGEQIDQIVAAYQASELRRTAPWWNPPDTIDRSKVEEVYFQVKAEAAERVGQRLLTGDVLKPLEKQVWPPYGERAGWLTRLMPFTQFAAWFSKIPSLARGSKLALGHYQTVTNMEKLMWKGEAGEGFVNEKGEFDSALLEKLGRSGSRLNQALWHIALLQQIEGRLIVGKEMRDYLQKKMPSLTEEEMATVEQGLIKFEGVRKRAVIVHVRALVNSVHNKANAVMQFFRPELDDVQARKLTEPVIDFWLNRGSMSAQEQVQRVKELNTLGLTPDELNKLNVLGQVGEKELANMRKNLSQEGYFSLVRSGEWLVAWKDQAGKRGVAGYKTKAEGVKKLEELRKQDAALKAKGEQGFEYIKEFNSEDQAAEFRGLDHRQVGLQVEAEQRLFNAMLAQVNLTEEQKVEIQQHFMPGVASQKLNTSPYMLERKLVMGGVETVNPVESMVRYVSSVAIGSAKRATKEQIGLLKMNPDFKANPNLRLEFTDYMKMLVDPPGSEFTTLKNIVWFNTMALNPVTLPVELTQQYLVFLPWLVSKQVPIGKALRYMVSSMAKVGQKKVTRQDYTDVDLFTRVQKAKDDGLINEGWLAEMFDLQDRAFVNERNFTSGSGAVLAAGELAKKPMFWVLHLARNIYGMSTRFNAEAAYVAGYEYAKNELKLTGDQADAFARDGVNQAFFGGGVANRPMLFSKFGAMKGIGGLVFALQSYTANSLAFYARLGRDAITKNLPPTERPAARRALFIALATQGAMGGLMGMPFIAALVALAEQFKDDWEVKKNLRKGAYSLGRWVTDEILKLPEEDAKYFGHLFADGALSGTFNAAIPLADIGSRFQLGNIFGVNSYEGFSWGNLLGPVSKTLENAVTSVGKAAQGKFGEAAEKFPLLPAGARYPLQLLNDGMEVRDKQGDLVLHPTQAEKILMFTGIRPKRIAQAYEQEAMRLRGEKAAAARLDTFHQEMADVLLAGDSDALQRSLLEKWEETGHRYDPKVGLARIIEIAVARSTPRKQMEQGMRVTAPERLSLEEIYPKIERPSEKEIYLATKEKERQFGSQWRMGRPERSVLQRLSIKEWMQRRYPNLPTYAIKDLANRQIQRQEALYRGQAERLSGGQPR